MKPPRGSSGPFETQALGAEIVFVVILAVCAAVSPVSPDVDDVAARLAAGEPAERLSALREVAGLPIDQDEARALLAPLMDDPDVRVRRELVSALETLLDASSLSALSKLAEDSDLSVRRAFAGAACRHWDDRNAKRACRAAYGSGDELVRVEVLSALGPLDPDEADLAAMFRFGLTDRSPIVRRAAVFGVGKARDAEAVALLSAVARGGPDLAAVPAVEEGLARIGSRDALAEIAGLCVASDEADRPAPASPSVRAAAARALIRLRAPGASAVVASLATDPAPFVRLAAVDSLTSSAASYPHALAGFLADERADIAALAVAALAGAGSTDAFELLAKEAPFDGSADVRLREAFAAALGAFEDERAVALLSRYAMDVEPSVRLRAARSLGETPHDSALVPLADLLSDTAPEVARAAELALEARAAR